jgi:hypothetical protein
MGNGGWVSLFVKARSDSPFPIPHSLVFFYAEFNVG